MVTLEGGVNIEANDFCGSIFMSSDALFFESEGR